MLKFLKTRGGENPPSSLFHQKQGTVCGWPRGATWSISQGEDIAGALRERLCGAEPAAGPQPGSPGRQGAQPRDGNTITAGF